MNIGQAATQSGVSAKMIRYYEEIGLLPPIQRGPQGYRLYTQQNLKQLSFIRRARELGFSIAEIQALMELWNDQKRQSAQVRKLAQTHLETLHQKIESLQHMADTLQHLVNQCANDEYADCSILDGLGREH
ncbi:Cu(I)-responsive transcriptional regulator [Orrella sp. 11846]|uniref:Cu(I)-responsive transcriptional regulator n=1 Tax=Orrella sp. 11846 TaxID=3409913 RepID=UPI003B5B76B1